MINNLQANKTKAKKVEKIKHTPIASKDTGCVCLSITEKDVIFFGKYGSFLNLFTFIKSFFKQK